MNDTTGVLGDRYFQRRNGAICEMEKNWKQDSIIRAIAMLSTPTRILEIGCANGWRLNKLFEMYAAECHGIEPSSIAITHGTARYKNVILVRGEANDLPYLRNNFDLVVFGFCLYACAQSDLFVIAAEADRVLVTGGHLIVHDFYPSKPHYNVNPDCPELRTYKMDYSTMFSWNPNYTTVYRNIFPDPGNVAGDLVATVAFKKTPSPCETKKGEL